MRTYMLLLTTAALACGPKAGGEKRDSAAAAPMQPAAAPAAAPVVPPPSLAGSSWQWLRFVTPVETVTPDDPSRYTVAFGADSALTVRADCNRGRGQYITDGNKVTFSPIALTRMGCPPGSLDTRFARELQRVAVYAVRGDTLLLELPVDSGTLLFLRLP